MSIAALNEVSNEVRRLSIAGASLAPGDFRLQKLIEPLEKSGAKAPVFAKVAGSVKAVIESNERTAAKALLDLSTLVNAILYTQGKTGVEGELEPLETSPVQGTTTKTSYRVLAPLIEALTTTGQGRYELVEDAWKRGAFQDVRLIRPAILALGDRYGELATLVSEKVIPSFGPGIAPLLRDGLDPKGGVVHARRLRALAKIDPDTARTIARELIDDATKEVKIAAVEALGGSTEDVDILLEAAKAKVKDVRRAAFTALAGVPLAAVTELFRKAVQSKDLELVSDTIGDALTDDLVGPLVEEGEQLLADVTKNKSPDEAALYRLNHVLKALSGNLNEAAEAFLLKVFAVHDHFSTLRKVAVRSVGEDLNGEVAFIIASFGSDAAKKQLVDSRAKLSPSQIGYSMIAASRLETPQQVHKDFGKLLLKQSEIADVIENVLRGWYYHQYYERRLGELSKTVTWDEAWCATAMKAGRIDLVCHLAKPGDKKVETFLKKQLNYDSKKKLVVEKDDIASSEVLETLIRLGSKDAAKLTCQAVESVLGKSSYYWHRWRFFGLIPRLPVESVGVVEKFVKTLSDKHIDDVLPHLADLKTKAARAKQ